MMHPPFDWDDPELKSAVEKLKQDPFLINAFENRDMSSGYTSLDGLVEENCVKAMDQQISEKFGISTGPENKWKDLDGGMHVLAPVLYTLMKEDFILLQQKLFSRTSSKLLITGAC